jgi:hypothetical protein
MLEPKEGDEYEESNNNNNNNNNKTRFTAVVYV